MQADGGAGGRWQGWRAKAGKVAREWRTWLTSRTGVVILSAVVIVALVVTALPNARPEPSTGPSNGPRPTATPGATAPPEAAWDGLALPAFESVAELRPVDIDTSGVAIASAFILRSRTATAAADLAGGLTAEPAIDFDVRPGATAAEATIVPIEPLAEGLVYRFRLTDPTGALAGSWAYRTKEPLHVVGSVPGNQTTGVPVTTGIEVEFDQDGVSDISDQFSIDPAATGRFEVHSRTVVFVPDVPLVAATTYRVSIAAGVTMSGSDQVLEAPVSFAFETAGPAGATAAWDVALGRPVLEANPSEAPVIGVTIIEDGRAAALTSLPLEVYRLASFDAAHAAALKLADDPGWGEWRSTSIVPVTGLPRVATFDGTFESTSQYGYKVVRFPAPLAVGWYLVVVPRETRDRQILLQVTTLSAFALTSETRTLAWVNDLATGESIAGASISDPAGSLIGTTGDGGLLDVPTPASLQRLVSEGATWEQASIVSVTAPDGRQLLVALGLRSNTNAYDYARNDLSQVGATNRRWWHLLATDRTAYRSTDTVHAWGLIRARLDASVPSGLELTLRAPEATSEAGPWLARIPVSATSRGTWTGDILIEDLPIGGYIVELHAAGEVASETWLQVVEIRKPAYRIEVETTPRAVIAGDPVAISGRALFFDGTSAAGLDLVVGAFGQDHPATTDADGRVSVTLDTRTSSPGIDVSTVGIRPVDPEEAEIAGSAWIVVVPSSTWITAAGTLTDGSVVIAGTLSRVDLDRVEQELAVGGWPEDPSGTPISGETVTIRVVASVPVEKQVGTTYDYIEKQVIPLIEYSYRDQVVGTYTTTSAADGSIALSVPASVANASYTATVTARDAAGRTATTTLYAAPSAAASLGQPNRPYLGGSRPCEAYSEEHAVGEAIDLTMHDGDGTTSSGGRYLFVVAGRGIRDVLLQDTPTLIRTYTEADLPNVGVMAVRFQNGIYVMTNEVLIRTRLDERTLGVEVTADRGRYAPGDHATLSIRTTDADGDPIAADVVMRAVDEKLFALGYAYDIDALGQLLAPLGDGLLQSYVSHPVPMAAEDGCGDTSGGDGDTVGARDDFRDAALFRLVSTGSDGRGSVEFDLPDDLTSWHVSATALTDDTRAGARALLLPVGLPFFADAILASDYLVGERPIVRVRSFGDSLASDDRVRFTVGAASLLLRPTTVEATAFASATIQLPDLPPGIHELTISATVIGDPARKDALVRKIVVRSSRLEVATTEVTTPAEAAATGGAGLTTYVLTDAGRGSLIPILQELAHGSGARSDRLLAAALARDLLVGTFGFDDASLPPVDLDFARYERGGIALLPYSSADLSLTALLAIVAPERLNRDVVRFALQEWLHDGTALRERRIIALAGLAGLGDDVLAELRAVDAGAVTIREALWTALGLMAAGDEDGARVIERSLLEEYGQALGPWVRLDVTGTRTETLEAASLLALVAAGIGDPLAPRIDRYVRDVRTSEALYVLPQIGVIRSTLERLPRAAARFAWTVDGDRHVETLAPGASWAVALTERQRASLRLETLEGALAVVATWTRTPDAADLPSGDLVTIARTVTPTDDAPTTGLVKVSLHVVFAPTAPTGCWDVTDRTPSGLAPITSVPGWPEEARGRSVLAPYEVAGQLVSWCLDPIVRRDFVLGYSARVVSAGTYAWEPAVVQSVMAPEVGATTPLVSYTIR